MPGGKGEEGGYGNKEKRKKKSFVKMNTSGLSVLSRPLQRKWICEHIVALSALNHPPYKRAPLFFLLFETHLGPYVTSVLEKKCWNRMWLPPVQAPLFFLKSPISHDTQIVKKEKNRLEPSFF